MMDNIPNQVKDAVSFDFPSAPEGFSIRIKSYIGYS